MRLLNTRTLELHEFFASQVPLYAILSHRWGVGEVTFHDLRDGKGPSMYGYAKIQGFCRQALEDGFEFGWIDTCCIDKSDSSELSEAIISMFMWYQKAEVCYAYLTDVDGEEQDEVSSSDWFKRGWTLQELLAPEIVVFFNHHWVEIGTKDTLDQLISEVTVIDFDAYESGNASVAQKMSWAAGRQTTRVEDRAYCLMGLFGVHMPHLYGEGEGAFLRLQIAILGKTVDDSIFTWCSDGNLNGRTGLLATSPDDFQGSEDVVAVSQRDFRNDFVTNKNTIPGHYSMTVLGLKLEADLRRPTHSEHQFILPLACGRKRKGQAKPDGVIGINLAQVIGSPPYVFQRVSGALLSYQKEDLRDIDPTVLTNANYTVNGSFWVEQQRNTSQFRSEHTMDFIVNDSGLLSMGYTYQREDDSSGVPGKLHLIGHNELLMFAYSHRDMEGFRVIIFNDRRRMCRKRLHIKVKDWNGDKGSDDVMVTTKRKVADGIPFYEVQLRPRRQIRPRRQLRSRSQLSKASRKIQ